MRKRLIGQQETKVLESGKDYEAWRTQQAGPEPVQANPDSLTEDQGFYNVNESSKEIQERVQRLLKIAKQVLTEQQYKVFDLIGLRCMTQRRAAKLLGLSHGRIDKLWQVSRHKLQKVYEERTQ